MLKNSAPSAELPAALREKLDWLDSMADDECEHTLDLLADVTHDGNRPAQAERPPASEASRRFLSSVTGMEGTHLSALQTYLSALLHGSRPDATDTPLEQTLKDRAARQRLTRRLAQVQSTDAAAYSAATIRR